MKAIDLLVGFGSVKDSYVISAEEFRQGKHKAQIKRLSTRKMWLIAAVIALTLLLVGCAVVYVLSLQDMAFGEELQEYYDGSYQTRTMLSLQGVKGTPGYQASKEWYEWLQTYDPDEIIYHSEEAFSEDFGDDYYAYNLYTRDMKDKLDEICAKYGLMLLGKMYVDPDEAEACQALQIQGILRPGVQAETNFGGIRYYADGSFKVEGYMTLTGPDSAWPYEEIVSFACFRKNSFSGLYESIGPDGSYEEWTYTTSNGVDVLIVLEQRTSLNHRALMIVDRGDYVFTFSALEYDRDWTKAALEAFAEAFDFTVQPQPVTQEALVEAEERKGAADEEWAAQYDKNIHSYSELGYDARIKSRMEFSTHPSQLGFWVTDLNGDGLEELVVGENGYIITVYTKRDNGTQYLMYPTTGYPAMISESYSYLSGIGVGSMVSSSYMYLCEDNTLAYVFASTDGSIAYHFAKIENGNYTWGECIFYNTSNESFKDHPWNMYPDMSHPNSVPITEEEFNDIVRSHPRIPVTLTPITQYPLADNSPSGIGRPDTVYSSYDALIHAQTEWDTDRSDWFYCLIDLDGDGHQELFLQEGAWKGVLTVSEGRVKLLECGGELTICEGNIIAFTRSYLDGNQTHCYYRVENGNAVLIEYLRHDKDVNPDNPWFRSADASGQDISMEPISKADFDAIRGGFTPVELEWKPISEFPLD